MGLRLHRNDTPEERISVHEGAGTLRAVLQSPEKICHCGQGRRDVGPRPLAERKGNVSTCHLCGHLIQSLTLQCGPCTEPGRGVTGSLTATHAPPSHHVKIACPAKPWKSRYLLTSSSAATVRPLLPATSRLRRRSEPRRCRSIGAPEGCQSPPDEAQPELP